MAALQWDDNLMLAAKDHVLDTGPSGLDGHVGTNGSRFWDRVEKYTKM